MPTITLRVEGSAPEPAARELARALAPLVGAPPAVVRAGTSAAGPDERGLDRDTAFFLITLTAMAPSALNDGLALADRVAKVKEAEAVIACTRDLQRQGRCARVMVERPGLPPRPLDQLTPAELLDAVHRR